MVVVALLGSGKSYLAKMLRDLEVENGGNAPRIHSMDDYFMTEVEKVFLMSSYPIVSSVCYLIWCWNLLVFQTFH